VERPLGNFVSNVFLHLLHIGGDVGTLVAFVPHCVAPLAKKRGKSMQTRSKSFLVGWIRPKFQPGQVISIMRQLFPVPLLFEVRLVLLHRVPHIFQSLLLSFHILFCQGG
jgi:hypothetical protein